MALTDATPTIVAAMTLRYLAHNSVFAARVNRMFENEAMTGSSVDIVSAGSVSVGPYNPARPLAWGRYEPGDKVSISLDQKTQFNLRVEDIDERQSRPSMMLAAVDRAGKDLMTAIDTHVREVFHGISSKNHNIGATDGKIDFDGGLSDTDAAKIKNAFIGAGAMMDNARIPKMGRWCIAGPALSAALNLIFSQGRLGDAVLTDSLRNGFAGRLYGMNLYTTSNPKTGADQEFAMFGNDYAVGHIRQINKVERIRLPDYFADGYRGLVVYGSTILEPAGLGEATFHFDNLPAFS